MSWCPRSSAYRDEALPAVPVPQFPHKFPADRRSMSLAFQRFLTASRTPPTGNAVVGVLPPVD